MAVKKQGSIKTNLKNVANVLKVAITGKDLSGNKAKVTANTKSPVLNKVLEAGANNPFVTAGIVTGGIYATKTAVSTIATATAIKTTGTKLATSGLTSKLGAYILPALGGYAIGSLTSGTKAGASNPFQSVNPAPTQNTRTSQDTTANTWNTSNITNKTTGANSPLYSSAEPYFSTDVSPSQTSNPTQPLSVTTGQDSTGGSASGTNWVTIALIGAGIYFLTKQ